MQEGAFVLIDCLGFKGIWQRIEDPKLVLAKLHKIATTVKDQLNTEEGASDLLGTGYNIEPKRIDFKTGFFSDTVFIGIQYNEENPDRYSDVSEGMLVRILSCVVIKILHLFIEEEPRLIMRGCVTYGEFICEGDFYAGPAVDLAAEYMNLAEGAFVWLDKSAANHYEALVDKIWKVTMNMMPFSSLGIKKGKLYFAGDKLFKYKMPIKDKGSLECYVINPLSNYDNKEKLKAIIHNYELVMEKGRIDVWVKRQNTLKFLKKGKKITKQYHQLKKKNDVSDEQVKHVVETIVNDN